jgi:UV DNA damage repair endonuclease
MPGRCVPRSRERQAHLDRRRGRPYIGHSGYRGHPPPRPGGLTLEEAFYLSLPAWESRGTPPELHLSSQDPEKQAGAHAYSVELADWQALVNALEGRTADVMVEAKGKEHALILLGVEF